MTRRPEPLEPRRRRPEPGVGVFAAMAAGHAEPANHARQYGEATAQAQRVRVDGTAYLGSGTSVPDASSTVVCSCSCTSSSPSPSA